MTRSDNSLETAAAVTVGAAGAVGIFAAGAVLGALLVDSGRPRRKLTRFKKAQLERRRRERMRRRERRRQRRSPR